MHPITDSRKRMAWIKEQLEKGRKKAELYHEIAEFYPVKSTIASQIGSIIDEKLMDTYKREIYITSFLFVASGCLLMGMTYLLDPFAPMVLFLEKSIPAALLLFSAWLLFTRNAYNISMVRFLAFMAVPGNIGQFALLNLGGAPLELEALSAVSIGISILLVFMTFYLKRKLAGNWGFRQPLKDASGNYMF